MNVPALVGVPTICPLLVRLRPGGRVPEMRVQVYGGIPPAAGNWRTKFCPWIPDCALLKPSISNEATAVVGVGVGVGVGVVVSVGVGVGVVEAIQVHPVNMAVKIRKEMVTDDTLYRVIIYLSPIRGL